MAVSSSVNYWPDSKCAKAFWSQHELPPYQELLKDTASWVEPKAGERWLDLGCGGGQLSKLVWSKSKGTIEQVVGIDVAAVNEQAYAKLRQGMNLSEDSSSIQFLAADLSLGLPQYATGTIDGIVSGLALQYAEKFDETRNQWTNEAYIGILREAHRLLKPGCGFVFSVNVPDPAWWKVAMNALSGVKGNGKPLRYLKKAWRIYSYGNWLKRESKRGRFHYLPVEEIEKYLRMVGFGCIESKVSFAGQAFVFRCVKPLVQCALTASPTASTTTYEICSTKRDAA